MPKTAPDKRLQEEAIAFVATLGNNGSEAARRTGVKKSTLWRFLQTGCAMEETRSAIREGISRNKSETTALNEPSFKSRQGKASITADDLKAIRAICQNMITLVDEYESSSGGAN